MLRQRTLSAAILRLPNPLQRLMKIFIRYIRKTILYPVSRSITALPREDEFNYIKDKTGKLPAIKGFDFGETCPLYYWDAQTAERAIDWVNNKGGIATASWHINVPVTMSEYTLGSTMDFSKTTYSEKNRFCNG